MDISSLTNSELQRLISRYTQGWQVSWSSYSRERVVEILQTNGQVYAIIQKIARAAQNINLMVGNTLDDSFEETPNNPLYKLINTPNILMTRKEFIEIATIHYMSFGECFITYDTYDGGNNRGQAIEGTFQLIPPQLVDIKHKGYIPFEYVINNDFTGTIPAERVIHIKNYNPDYQDLHGLSPVQVALTLIDKWEAANTTETLTFQKGGPAYLVTPKEADGIPNDDEFRGFMGLLRSIWKRERKGVAGVNKPVEVHHLGETPVAMGTIESQNNTVKVLLTIWGLDAGLFDVSASTYNNKQVMDRTVYTEAALPFVNKMVDKLNARFKQVYGAEITTDTSGIEALQDNYKVKAEWMTLAGVFSENEIREAMGYDEVDAPSADLTPSQQMDNITEGFNDDDLNEPVVR
jgi:HK97 family phage portal protein